MRHARRVIYLLCATGLACLLLGQTGCRRASLDPQDAVLETARKAFLSGQYGTAEDTYQYYLQMYPKGRFRLEAWQRLADIRQDSRDSPRDAALLLETALLEFSCEPSVSADLLLRAARFRAQAKDYALACAHYAALLSLSSLGNEERLDAYLQVAHLRLLTNDAPGALAILQECRQSKLKPAEQAFCSFRQAEIFLMGKSPSCTARSANYRACSNILAWRWQAATRWGTGCDQGG